MSRHGGGGGDGGAGGGLGSGGRGSASFSGPWTPPPGSGSGPGGASGGSSGRSDPSGGRREPPEKRLTLFALRLAVLEKAASGLGKLDFVWATVVLLGGFVGSLNTTDFWCITVILAGEGARVFGRSHELEWQHHASQAFITVGGVLRSSSRFFRRVLHLPSAATDDGARRTAFSPAQVVQRHQIAAVTLTQKQRRRTWHAPDVSLLPYTGWVSASRNIGRLLNWLQVLSAFACVALSLMRLWKHNFSDDDDGTPSSKNKRPALLLFYTLALLEACLFLLEKAYWVWGFDSRRLLQQVADECQLGAHDGPVSLRRFFYDAYSRCVDGSIFDGIKMDLVTFAEDLVLSDFLDEQLIGVRVLEQFAKNAGSGGDTLRKVGTNPRSVERLVEMLSWKRLGEEEVRRSAAEVVSKLAGKRQNALRLSAIPGAIESVASLLYTGRGAAVSGMHPQPPHPEEERRYDYLPFNLQGLRILKKLARDDQDNCGKIESARGLLAKIVDFTWASPDLLDNQHASDSQVRAVKRALQVVKMLASTTGRTGEALRQGLASNVFAVSNLRWILRYGRLHRELQKLAIDVLTALAMGDTGKEAITGTGGLVTLLLSVFVGAEDGAGVLAREAGEALAMLALESDKGCAAILKRADVLGHLVSALQLQGDSDGGTRRLNAARVLRSLCAYSGSEHRERLRVATEALPAALRLTMTITESDKVILEVCVGLTTQICGFVDGERFAAELRRAGVEERAYVERLAGILRDHKYPEIKVPRMRRFVVQQVIWMMKCSRGDGYVELLKEVGMEGLLESIADTTSELECYHVFSGSVGIGKHRESFCGIVDTALELIARTSRSCS
ncbi:unnamed protein product [Urochloa decumbens]|uniref:ARM repeat superfamily protein n=1 Tax=Urochloa decumbens TaxID=240449 RepID=A0ABC8XF14_9POAL